MLSITRGKSDCDPLFQTSAGINAKSREPAWDRRGQRGRRMELHLSERTGFGDEELPNVTGISTGITRYFRRRADLLWHRLGPPFARRKSAGAGGFRESLKPAERGEKQGWRSPYMYRTGKNLCPAKTVRRITIDARTGAGTASGVEGCWRSSGCSIPTRCA